MEKLLFIALISFVSCTRYVYTIIPTQSKETTELKPYYQPFKGDDMPFGKINFLPYDFTLPHKEAKIGKDTIYYYKIDSSFMPIKQH